MDLYFWLCRKIKRKKSVYLKNYEKEVSLYQEHRTHTVLSVATRNVPGTETPAPPPMVTPSRIATCMKD